MKLSEAVPGQRVAVVGVDHHPSGTRLEAVGFVSGTTIDVVRRAPMGDPTLYLVRGTQLALRRDTAKLIDVEIVE